MDDDLWTKSMQALPAAGSRLGLMKNNDEPGKGWGRGDAQPGVWFDNSNLNVDSEDGPCGPASKVDLPLWQARAKRLSGLPSTPDTSPYVVPP